MNAVEILRKKRDGKVLTREEIQYFIKGISKKEIPEYQATAWLMATFLNGMEPSETVALTEAMIASGERVQFSAALKKLCVDKHSTGGIGDKISLILAPLVACLGLKVPMVAGRGLGFTGGTLDKLESIDGFQVRISTSQFMNQVSKTGCAIMGQTDEFVPADKLLYSLRDVTSTVECVPLITGSILSKKAAEGISGLVLDIKVGSGAFMKNMSQAQVLGKSLISVGKKLGLNIRAVLTNMNQPLGYSVGNALEVYECIALMKEWAGEKKATHPMITSDFEKASAKDIKDLTVELAAHMLVVGGMYSSLSASRTLACKALKSGEVLKKFSEMCAVQGAKYDCVANPEKLPISKEYFDITSRTSSIVQKIQSEEIGHLCVTLGGGRRQASDVVDHSVGILISKKLGDKVKKGETLMRVYYNSERLKKANTSVASLQKSLEKIYSISKKKVAPVKLIQKVMQ